MKCQCNMSQILCQKISMNMEWAKMGIAVDLDNLLSCNQFLCVIAYACHRNKFYCD
jgi:hypothetical protein